MEDKTKVSTIDAYIAGCPPEYRERLEELRRTIREVVPEATETISWGMPSFRYHGILVQFMLHKKHIGFYPFPSGIELFLRESSAYKTGKGSIQFPLSEPVPFGLVRKVVAFRVYCVLCTVFS